MYGPREHLTEWNKSDDRQTSHNTTHVESLKKGTNEPIYKTDRVKYVESKLMVI